MTQRLSTNARFHFTTQSNSKITQVAIKRKQLRANQKERKNPIIIAITSRVLIDLILVIKITKMILIL